MTPLVFRVSLLLALLTQSSMAFGQGAAMRSYLDDNSMSDFGFQLSTSLSETPVKASSADHGRYYSITPLLSYKLGESYLEFINNPYLSLQVTYGDEIGYEDNDSNLGNASLGAVGLSYEFTDALSISAPLYYTFATNSDDIKFRGFQGAVLVQPGISYSFEGGALNGLSLSFDTDFRRYFYEFDATKNGVFNPRSSQAYGLSLGYKYRKFSFGASARNNTTTLTDGSQLDDSYSASLSTSYKQTDHLSYGLSWSQRDRTFGYDGASTNIDFRYADLTLLSLSLTYSI